MTRASAGSGERMRGMTGFFIDTQGHCFLCSNRVSSLQSGTTTPPHSLQYLSRYLKLNLRKVFGVEVNLPPKVVAKLEKGVLGARLCEGCALLNDRFSELCSQLEEIRMEVEDCLRGIHDRLSQTEEEWQELSEIASGADKNLTLRIAEALRKQAIVKASLKLRHSQPRIRLPKLRMEPINVPIPMDTDESEDMSAIPVIQYILPMKEEGPAVALDLDNEDTGDGIAETHETPRHNDDAPPESLGCDFSTHLMTTDSDVKQERIEVSVDATKPIPLQKSHKPTNVGNPDCIYNTATKKFQCKLCQKQFNRKPHWSGHYRSIHQKLRPKCSLCNKDYRDTDSLALHHKTVHLGRRFRCRTCAKVFYIRGDVAVHQRESQGTCRVGSDEVEVVFSKQYKIPNEPVRFKCRSCPKKFATLGYRRLHFRKVHLNLGFTCSQCDKTYVKKDRLQEHFKEAHPGKDNIITRCYSFNASTRKYECKPCRKQFSSEIDCSIHYKNAHSKLMEKCSLCPMEFHHRSSLHEHYNRVHLKIKFRCRTCSLVSPYRWKILAHQRKSQGTCRSGGNEIEAVETMVNEKHKKITDPSPEAQADSHHSSAQPGTASETFLNDKHLAPQDENPEAKPNSKRTSHQVDPHPTGKVPPPPVVWIHPKLPATSNKARRIQSRKKKRECKNCGREFGSEWGLELHRESVHMGLRYKCEACDNIFTQKGYLQRHQQIFCRTNPDLNPNQGISQKAEIGDEP